MQISKKIIRIVGQTNAKYNMFEEGDKILLALSGGKDSMVLAHILRHFNKVSPLKWEFQGLSIGYGIGEDFQTMSSHCNEFGIKHEIMHSDIFKFGQEKLRKNTTFCSFCSRMRRGYIYSYALKNGFNKIAIGHHLDDAVESFFMNFTYNGALRTLAPKYTAENGLVIIRPSIFLRERQIIDCVKANNIPVIKEEEYCPAKKHEGKMPHARASAKELLRKLENDNPKLFISLKSAFENIHTETFFK